MRILMPLDGSDASKNTLQWAGGFLNPETAEVLLLSVYHFSPEGGYRYPTEEASEKILSEARSQLEADGIRVVSSEMVLGGTAEVICDFAKTRDIDQIIMGARGSGLSRMVMGSSSKQVMECSDVPVVVVENNPDRPLKVTHPQAANLGEAPIVETPKSKRLKVLLPVDGSEPCWNTLRWAANFLSPQQAELYLLYVIPYHPSIGVLPGEETDADALLLQARNFFEEKGFQVNTKRILEDPANGICSYAETFGMDQIIIGTRGKSNLLKSMLGSVSSKVASWASTPVLLLRNMEVSQLEVPQTEAVPLTLKDPLRGLT